MDGTINAFKELYNKVIDSDGNMKACGRDKCMLLIEIAKSIDAFGDFGNKKTGRININNMKKLYNSLT